MENISFKQINRIGSIDLLASIRKKAKKRKTTPLSVLAPVQQYGSIDGDATVLPVTTKKVHQILSGELAHYLWTGRIPLIVTLLYVPEASYSRNKCLFHVLAFPNNFEGFDLLDRKRLYHILPNGPIFFGDQSQAIAIFRNISDVLSAAGISALPIQKFPGFSILNAPNTFQNVQPILSPYHDKDLLRSNNAAGIALCRQATHAFLVSLSLYNLYSTLNDWTCRIGTSPGLKTPSFVLEGLKSHPTRSCPLIRPKCPSPPATARCGNVAQSDVARRPVSSLQATI